MDTRVSLNRAPHRSGGTQSPANPPVDPSVFDVERIRKDFPVLHQQVHGRPLVYLDNAATSQKPQAVIDALTHYYKFDNSNVHRGVHTLSMRATDAYEDSREKAREFINAQDQSELIFVRGTTEGINLVAQSFGQTYIHAGDEVLITAMEHHSNIVPWQIVCEARGATLKVAPMNEAGEIPLDSFEKLLTDRTKILAVAHVSNSLGTVNPVAKMIELAHDRRIPVLIDGAQAAPHVEIDVQALDCEFYVFSSHKMYGPTGIGVVYGKRELLDAMPPYQGGGDMIASVTFEKTIYNTLPHKFEAGTPNVAGVVGFGAAIDYVQSVGLPAIGAHEHELIKYAEEKLLGVDGVRLIGTAREKAGSVSFVLEDIHPHDVGTILDQEGVAVRTGHHCTQPVMEFFEIPATSRASFGMYNTKPEIDALIAAIYKVKEVFG
jgi:cysteine desulfurase/selenocysteine lyase